MSGVAIMYVMFVVWGLGFVSGLYVNRSNGERK